VTPAADTRERILEAALAAFAEKGFDGATTREIANRAGVQLGLIQYHFGGKQKLWQEAVDRSFEEIGKGLDEAEGAVDGEDALARTRAAIRAHVHYVARHPEFVRLMHDEGKRRGPRMRWIVDRHVKLMFARMEPMIRRLQEAGRLPADIEPLHFVYGLIGAIDVVFHQAEECRRVTGADPTDPDFIDQHARAVEHMLLGAPRRLEEKT
jgi:AcrR family transcriptional regulator